MRRSLRLAFAGTILSIAAVGAQEPVVSGAGATYSLRAGDIVRVDVWGQTQYSGQFQVDERGILQYPVIGEIDTRSLTVADLRDRIRAGLETVFNAPFITVTPLFRMAVLGEVARPGLYTVDPTLSVIDVVAMAGGPARNGDLNKIRLLRDGEQLQVSFQRQNIQGRSLQEIGVRSGDQILVARRPFTRDDAVILLQAVQITISLAILIRTFN
ncbi:MAG TPA: polysaccharide biosynthesis/export family protein [Gemmatimonadales bacterium]|nr:polysaccharide biosynthesis/export family protein [Gemmatimonadales bacterium]